MKRARGLLAAVQVHCRKMRWHRPVTPYTRHRHADGFYILPRERAGTDGQRAAFLALIREWRWLLRARWENPLAWAQTFGLLETHESTALTVARKLNENRRA